MTNNHIKILLVEDSRFDAFLVKEILAALNATQTGPNFDIVHVERLSQLVNVVQEQAFDLILLDLSLPDSDGLETIRRALKAAPDLPIVIMSGLDDEASALEAVQAGAQDYLVKGSVGANILSRAIRYAIERKQTEKRLQRQAAQLALINELGGNLAAVLELDILLDRAADLIQETFGYHHVALFLIDQGVARLKAIAGAYQQHFSPTHSQSLDKGLIGWVANHGLKLVANDISREPRHISLTANHVATQAELCLPIQIAGQTIGVLDLQSPQLNAFDDDEVMAMEILTSQIAIAIENARLYQAIQQELAERKHAEESLRQAHLQNTQLLASISAVLIGVNADDQITHWNTPSEAAFGLKAVGVVGESFLTCAIRWDWLTILQCVSECRAKGRSAYRSNIRYTRTDDRDGFLNITVTPFAGDATERPGFLLLGEETTERKILESQLIQAQKLEAIGQLAAGIAHEINTPIQYIGDNITFLQASFATMADLFEKYAALLQLARSGTLSEARLVEVETLAAEKDADYLLNEIPAAIGETLEGVDRVAGIVRAMKEFSHPGIDQKTAININKAIQGTITVARNEWKYIADVVTDLEPDLPLIPCLPVEFNQVILNILVNAGHAIADAAADKPGAKGRITISTRLIDDRVEIRIADSGTGIPEAIRSKIFDPFFTTKEVGRGTGQGLAIAYDVITKKHQGTITFETEIGQGTTFIITLPVEPDSITS